MNVHRDDNVMILAGRDSGKTGRVIRVLTKEDRVLVEKVNMVKRHTRPNQQVPQGGIVEKEAPVHVSNVMVICNKCGKPTRVAHKKLSTGKNVRLCKKCGEILDKEK
jgi:large subunit ribosomal protein L24